jgi:hypothetical protein
LHRTSVFRRSISKTSVTEVYSLHVSSTIGSVRLTEQCLIRIWTKDLSHFLRNIFSLSLLCELRTVEVAGKDSELQTRHPFCPSWMFCSTPPGGDPFKLSDLAAPHPDLNVSRTICWISSYQSILFDCSIPVRSLSAFKVMNCFRPAAARSG